MALTEKQKRFVDEYLVDLNATQAAIRAGYSERNADKIGSELLGKTRVSEAIQEAIKLRQERTEITQDMVLEELARVAFANGTDFARVAERDGAQVVEIVNTDDVPTEKRAAIAGIKYGKFGIEVSMADKLKALELVGKHLGMFDPRLAPKGNEESGGVIVLTEVEDND